MSHPLKIGVLGSGRGTNYVAIQAAIDAGTLAAEVRIVISDNENAFILDHARSHGIRAVYVPPGGYKTRMDEAAELQVVNLLKESDVELVVLAGYMRMVKRPLLNAFAGRMINIHPSLLPAYPGLHAWKQALEAGASVSGCTVHWVDAGMDTGPLIDREEVDVFPTDTAESLHARIQEAEHRVYPRAIAAIAGGLRHP